MENDSRIILASASPRRISLLHKIVEDFDVVSPSVDESTDGTDPKKAVETIAARKAFSIETAGTIISADTVVYNGRILGKPKDESDAYATLLELSGKKHTVYTGVCIRKGARADIFSVATDVYFKKLTLDDAVEYVKKYRPLDKAGSYGIQDGVVVDKIVGSYDNVVGLPTEEIKERLMRFISETKE